MSFSSGKSAIPASLAHGRLRRVGERDGLGAAISGKVARHQNGDVHVVRGVADALAAGELFDVAAAEELLLEGSQPVAREQNIASPMKNLCASPSAASNSAAGVGSDMGSA
jgi:hypothetical protein